MFRKTFVSIYFLEDRFQVIHLNSRKNKVSKYGTVSLPDGLVKNHKVESSDSLAKILKNTWKKLKIKEKSVGIVVPEFSTFSKLFSVPAINIAELDEAVRWQSQDFLPQASENMMLDWKLVDKKNDKYQVLVVAIRKDILESYVKAAEAAGLFPLVVETPSLSIVRVSEEPEEDESGARIILYGSFDEGLLIITRGSDILGSSVVDIGDKEDTINTASKIMSHYKSADVERVFVGGTKIDEGLINGLQDKLKKPVEPIKPDIQNFNDKQIQEYLIPISLQYKDAAEPADPNTVNLLPAPLVEQYKKAKRKVQAWSLTLTTTFIVWISFFAVLGTYLFLNQQISQLRTQNTDKREIIQQREETVEKAQDINNLSQQVLKIQNMTIPPQVVLNEITQARPEDVTLERYEMDFERGEIRLTGVAADRLSLIEFKRNLEESSNIGSAEIPISSFEVETNLEFSANIEYLPATPGNSGKGN